MNSENRLVKKNAANLAGVLGKLLKSKTDCPEALHKEYSKTKKCLDSLLETMDNLAPEKDYKYYEYQVLSEEGYKTFQKLVGESMTVIEACAYLGITEGVARNILHVSDHLVAVKAKYTNGRHRMFISKKSVEKFKDQLIHNPLGRGILSLYTTPPKAEDRVPEEIVCCDSSINSKLRRYVV